MLGSICVVDVVPRVWSAADLAALSDIAALARTALACPDAARGEARTAVPIEPPPAVPGDEARAEQPPARDEAEAAGRAKSAFLATMSHELRTPLNAAMGFVELMTEERYGPVTDAQRGALRRVQRSLQHILALADEVLQYARLEAGAMRYAPADVPFGAALAQAAALVQPLAERRGVALALERDVPALVAWADPERLQQILLNLLSNAIKFTPAGGRVSLTATPGDAVVRAQVRDTGIGIPVDQHAAIFAPFFQAGARGAADGAGLGLAISRDLARGMGGDLTVDSAPGAGATFTLTLPRGRRGA